LATWAAAGRMVATATASATPATTISSRR
jgi:hypothetical protein